MICVQHKKYKCPKVQTHKQIISKRQNREYVAVRRRSTNIPYFLIHGSSRAATHTSFSELNYDCQTATKKRRWGVVTVVCICMVNISIGNIVYATRSKKFNICRKINNTLVNDQNWEESFEKLRQAEKEILVMPVVSYTDL